MVCPKCGKEIADDSIFCEFCGVMINQITSNDQTKNKKGLIVFLILLLVCNFACIAWMAYREITYGEYVDNYYTNYSHDNWSWSSSNHKDGSSSSKEYAVFLDSEDCITIDYEISSEDNCDKLIISLRYPDAGESIILETSGCDDSTIIRTVHTAGVYVLKFTYKKDSDVSKYDDCARIKSVSIDRRMMKELKDFSNDFFSF